MSYLIDILVATYNGEAYLRDQLNSIINQTEKRFRILIRDDGSTDSTDRIIQSFENKYPDKIKRLHTPEGNMGAADNFLYLLSHSDAAYAMFADQDDIWLPHKIELTLKKMRGLEYSKSKSPVLVHTDLSVVDHEINMIHPSFMTYQGLNPQFKSLNKLVLQNNITGCTVMVNRHARRLINACPASGMVIHDWWIGLVLSLSESVYFLDVPTVLYRQHSGNIIGAKQLKLKGLLSRSFFSEKKNMLEATRIQASALLALYSGYCRDKDLKMLRAFAEIKTRPQLKKWQMLCKYNMYKQGRLRTVGLFFLI